MTNTRYTVAIVGCGTIGKVHADAIHLHPHLSVAALVDVDDALAARLADHIEHTQATARPAVYPSLASAIAGSSFDVVVVATPSGAHVEIGIESLSVGKHLLVEKPLDVDVARGRELFAAARDAAGRGVVSSVISQHRFDPGAVTVANAIAEKRFGRVNSAVASIAWWRSQSYYDSGDWRGTWALDGGGALMNQGIHTVDLLLWFLGKPVEIYAYTGLLAHGRIEVEDTAAAIIKFESGALATVHATTAAYPGGTARVQVYGDLGSGIIDDDCLVYFHAAETSGPIDDSFGLSYDEGNQADSALPLEQRVLDEDGLVPGHLRQYQDFYRALDNGQRPRVTVEDALDALATVRAVYLSATLGKPVLFAEVLAGKYDDLATTVD